MISIFNFITIFNNKFKRYNLGIFPAIAGNCPRFSFVQPALARIKNLGKFCATGLNPRGTPCYGWEPILLSEYISGKKKWDEK